MTMHGVLPRAQYGGMTHAERVVVARAAGHVVQAPGQQLIREHQCLLTGPIWRPRHSQHARLVGIVFEPATELERIQAHRLLCRAAAVVDAQAVGDDTSDCPHPLTALVARLTP